MRGVVLVFVAFALVAAEPRFQPLAPPSHRIDTKDVVKPLIARAAPVQSDQELPEGWLDPSASPIPIPLPVDTSVITVGNCKEHRTYLDYPEKLQVVFPGLSFPSEGEITEWDVYTGRDCSLYVQVFRPVTIPLALDENKYPVHNYETVGFNLLTIPEMGNFTFDVPEGERIKVQAGDVIGFYTASPGCVSYNDGGPQALYRYGTSGHNEIKAFGGTVFIGDGERRTYSIAARGNFSPLAKDVMERPSPSATPSNGLGLSTSPVASPSGSISATPVQSPTPSTSSTEQSLYEKIKSLAADGQDLHSRSDCARGPEFMCHNEHTMRLCNITASTCRIMMAYLHPIVTASATPSPGHSPSPSQSPSFALSLPPPQPSFSASPSLAVPGFMAPPAQGEGAGLTSCHYCNGGTDWTAGSCQSGKAQSPISLSFDDVTLDEKMDLYMSTIYNVTRARVSWNDYAFTIAAQGSHFGRMNLDYVNYDADLAVVRSPSEHKIEGYRTPMEIQIFHTLPGSNPPKTVAVAVLFEESVEDNAALNWVYSIPKDKSPFQIVVDLENFLSDLKPLVFYNGSLTQPPCTEGVQWAVSMGVAKVGHAQLKALNKFLKADRNFANGRGNNRALQSRNGREFVLRSNCGMSGQIECARHKGGKITAAGVPAEQGGAADEGMFGDEGIKLW
jgi:carbonic anhydrase